MTTILSSLFTADFIWLGAVNPKANTYTLAALNKTSDPSLSNLETLFLNYGHYILIAAILFMLYVLVKSILEINELNSEIALLDKKIQFGGNSSVVENHK